MTVATLGSAVDAACRRWPDRVALQHGERRITYASLNRAVARLAAAYGELGIARGDRVLCRLPNCPEHVLAMAAAWRIGAIHAGVDHQLTGPELSWLVGHTDAAALLYAPDSAAAAPWAPARTVRSKHPGTHLIATELGDTEVTRLSLCELIGDAWDEVRLQPEVAADSGLSGSDPAMIIFSSGTTGRPKGTVAGHGVFADAWHSLASWMGFVPEDVHLGHLPLSHGFGLSMALMALMTGGRVVLLDRFSASEALDVIGAQGVTILNGTPAHFRLLLDRLDPRRHSTGSLRFGVGTAATFPEPLLRRIFDDFGMDLMLMYGSSEGASVVTTDRQEMLLGSVGRPDPGTVAIVATDHTLLPAGEVGEIAFRRSQVPTKYWRHEAATSPAATALHAMDDGWFYTGDTGRLDGEGRLYVVGRLKHQIDRGGIKVDPGEVEAVLLRCPGVADAAVIGTPNPILGESVCACVVVAPGSSPSLAALRTLLSNELAPQKLPEELCLVDHIPRTQIGKVDRTRLMEDVAAREDCERLRARS